MINSVNPAEASMIFANTIFEPLGERQDRSGLVVQSFDLARPEFGHALRVKYWPEVGRILIQNSLHKFWKGNNYSDYSRAELAATVQYLAAIFLRQPCQFHLSRFEFGINFQQWEAYEFFKRLQAHRTNPFYFTPPPKGKSKPLERVCFSSQYRIKFYDKEQWTKLKEKPPAHDYRHLKDLIRYEIPILKMAKVYALTGKDKTTSPITLQDFTDDAFLARLGQYLIDTYNMIDKSPMIDLSHLSNRQREFLFAGQDPDYWQMEKRINSGNAKRKRREYLALKKSLHGTGQGYYQGIGEKISRKVKHLLES